MLGFTYTSFLELLGNLLNYSLNYSKCDIPLVGFGLLLHNAGSIYFLTCFLENCLNRYIKIQSIENIKLFLTKQKIHLLLYEIFIVIIVVKNLPYIKPM